MNQVVVAVRPVDACAVCDSKDQPQRRPGVDPIEWAMAVAFAVVGLVVLVSIVR